MLARLEEFLADHNATSKRPLPLALFLYAAEHVSRAARMLRQPGGHLLNVGVGGSGRGSLSRLAAYIEGLQVDQSLLNLSVASLCVLAPLPHLHVPVPREHEVAGNKHVVAR